MESGQELDSETSIVLELGCEDRSDNLAVLLKVVDTSIASSMLLLDGSRHIEVQLFDSEININRLRLVVDLAGGSQGESLLSNGSVRGGADRDLRSSEVSLEEL